MWRQLAKSADATLCLPESSRCPNAPDLVPDAVIDSRDSQTHRPGLFLGWRLGDRTKDPLLANRRPPFTWGFRRARTEVPVEPDAAHIGLYYWHGQGTGRDDLQNCHLLEISGVPAASFPNRDDGCRQRVANRFGRRALVDLGMRHPFASLNRPLRYIADCASQESEWSIFDCGSVRGFRGASGATSAKPRRRSAFF
jgi:hypothetical protein